MRAEDIEVIARDELAEYPLRIAAVHAQIHSRERVHEQVVDARGTSGSEIEKRRIGDVAVGTVAEGAVQRDEAVGVIDAIEEMAQSSVDPAEHADVRADAEAQRQDGDDRRRRL